MKRSRDDGDEEQPITEAKEMVYVVDVLDDGSASVYVADLTKEEIALIVPRFVGSGPICRNEEVSNDGPAAHVLRKFQHYVEEDPGCWYAEGPVKEVGFLELANSRARTIVWDAWE